MSERGNSKRRQRGHSLAREKFVHDFHASMRDGNDDQQIDKAFKNYRRATGVGPSLKLMLSVIVTTPVHSRTSTFWLDLLLPTEISQDVSANLEQIYENVWLPRHGKSKANLIWKVQVWRIIGGHILNLILTVWDRVKSLRIG
ncbi:MAG: hypothetical protein WBA44_09620 [Mesorhizobium sp.]